MFNLTIVNHSQPLLAIVCHRKCPGFPRKNAARPVPWHLSPATSLMRSGKARSRPFGFGTSAPQRLLNGWWTVGKWLVGLVGEFGWLVCLVNGHWFVPWLAVCSVAGGWLVNGLFVVQLLVWLPKLSMLVGSFEARASTYRSLLQTQCHPPRGWTLKIWTEQRPVYHVGFLGFSTTHIVELSVLTCIDQMDQQPLWQQEYCHSLTTSMWGSQGRKGQSSLTYNIKWSVTMMHVGTTFGKVIALSCINRWTMVNYDSPRFLGGFQIPC